MADYPDLIVFSVPGVPVAQPRIKATSIGGYARVYTPKTADTYKASVALAFRSAYGGNPIDGAVRVDIEFVMPRPKSMIWRKREMHSEWHTKKPDIDNLAKAAMDALYGLAWIDDSQVCSLVIAKRIASGTESPSTEIRIKSI